MSDDHDDENCNSMVAASSAGGIKSIGRHIVVFVLLLSTSIYFMLFSFVYFFLAILWFASFGHYFLLLLLLWPDGVSVSSQCSLLLLFLHSTTTAGLASEKCVCVCLECHLVCWRSVRKWIDETWVRGVCTWCCVNLFCVFVTRDRSTTVAAIAYDHNATKLNKLYFAIARGF